MLNTPVYDWLSGLLFDTGIWIGLVALFSLTWTALFIYIDANTTRLWLIHSLQCLVQPNIIGSYQLGLRWLVRQTDDRLGSISNIAGWRKAYGICLPLAAIYTPAFFLIGYGLFGGAHDIGGRAVLPDGSIFQQLQTGLTIVLGILAIIWVKQREIGWQRRAARAGPSYPWLLRLLVAILLIAALNGLVFEGDIGLIDWVILLPIIFFAFMNKFAVAVAVAVAAAAAAVVAGGAVATLAGIFIVVTLVAVAFDFIFEVVFDFAGTATPSVTVIAFIAVAVAVAVAVAAAVAVGRAGMVAATSAGAVTGAGIFVLFLFSVVFPLSNSLFDLLSLQISRWWIQRIQGANGFARIVGESILDLTMALLLLLILAIALITLIKLTNAGFMAGNPNDPALINWRGHIELASLDPWGEGFMVSAMLFSTLFPTFIHLLVGLAAVIPRLLRTAPWLLQRLDDYQQAHEQQDERARCAG